MKSIPLTQGKEALVDDEDYAWLSKWKWTAMRRGRHREIFYAYRTATVAELASGRTVTIFMHREILNTPPGFHTDHRDHDGLNNRRENLRVCTARQNSANARRPVSNNPLQGVRFRGRKYVARTQIKGRQVRIGAFGSAVEAADAYRAEIRKLAGEFAITNPGVGGT